jgi:UDP-N-acetylmuramate: L-alanyl-gamma-D-glutamyl-meso-diaminopimelate ligase
MLKERGYQVTGADSAVYPPASTLLVSLNIPWHDGFRAENLQPPPDLVVIGNVIARGNPELEVVLESKIPYISMAALLEEVFLPGHRNIVVAGTHGKTTTTAMLAWIFQCAERRPDFLVGGMLPNFGGRSYGLGRGAEFIIEGDEYETAFFDRGPKVFHYHPDELILTSCEFDHGDIYADLAAVELQFQRLVNLVPRNGRVLAWGESQAVARCVQKAFCPVETYAVSAPADWNATDIQWRGEQTHFNVAHKGSIVAGLRMALVGNHNVANALAAVAISSCCGIGWDKIQGALATFQGVARRMDIKGEAAGVLIVEDFAHHPTAISATIAAAHMRWPGRRLWAVVEPRSNTMRGKTFESELPAALASANGVVLGPVSRPQLLEDSLRLDPRRVAEIVQGLGRPAWAMNSAAEIAVLLGNEARAGDVILVMSNGNFDGLTGRLLETFAKQARTRGVAP